MRRIKTRRGGVRNVPPKAEPNADLRAIERISKSESQLTDREREKKALQEREKREKLALQEREKRKKLTLQEARIRDYASQHGDKLTVEGPKIPDCAIGYITRNKFILNEDQTQILFDIIERPSTLREYISQYNAHRADGQRDHDERSQGARENDGGHWGVFEYPYQNFLALLYTIEECLTPRPATPATKPDPDWWNKTAHKYSIG
jgi:hypothetical protein